MQADDESSANAQPGRLCNNCGTALNGPYCHSCGQPAKSLIRALPGLIGELASETLYYDSRMWRTLQCLLFKPGWLSRQYVDGRRARYTPPVRLYLVTSIFAFLIVTLVINASDLSLGSMTDDATREFAEGSGGAIQFGGQDWHADDNPFAVSWLGERGNAWLNIQIGIIDANAREAVNNPARFVRAAAGLLPQTMFVILPLFSALVAMFYLLARRYYIEHLLLQVHNHAFVFLSMVGLYLIDTTRGLLGNAAFFGQGILSGLLQWVAVAIWLWIPLYALLSMRRFYGQNWWLTLIKFFVLSVAYLIMLVFALAAVIVLGIWRL